MATRSGSPIAVKMEESAQSVIFTYFHGDIGSMVDQHFARALSKMCKAKTPAGRNRRVHKAVKSEESTPCQWTVAPSSSSSSSYSELQFQSLSGRLQLNKDPHAGLALPLSPSEEPPGPWASFPPRQGALGLPGVAYGRGAAPPEGLGQHYTTSLLNLLHNDRPEMKPELLPGWTSGFRDMEPGLEPGRPLDKKDMYWY